MTFGIMICSSFFNCCRMSHTKPKCCGPGYASPQEAIKGPREKILFTTCANTDDTKEDMLAAVDVDPNSETFCKVVSRVVFPYKGDEVHHTGWNACSSCHGDPSAKRSHLVLPCLNSSRIYIVNVENERNIRLVKAIEPGQLHKQGVSFPHTSHCLADGNIMISTLGDENGNHKGNFLLLDGQTFEPKGCWLHPKFSVPFNYDFWYQPRRDVMISTEWGTPNLIKQGFNPKNVEEGEYGHSVHVFKWSTHEKLQTIDLPLPEGALPLEVRFLHEPTSPYAFAGAALGSSIFLFRPTSDGAMYEAKCVAKVPSKKVEGWLLPEMPSLITDIIISMDDKYLYVSNWIHGDIRQYDITNPENIRLNSQIFLGGSIHTETGVKIIHDEELKVAPPARYVKGKRVEGGPQMLQLSLDGKRLYVTTSLYRKWDEQFYPNLLKSGAVMLLVHIGEDGKMTLNEDFLVDFGELEGGPYLAHEMRYPGGDCTSDIWI
uniref:Methanethiol oxidase n=1 Tax=Haemonchus contortus TaxID=6289 RepID=W6NB72_HAECO